jgi:hypothetical protein
LTYRESTAPHREPSNIADPLAHRQSQNDVGVVVRLQNRWFSAKKEERKNIKKMIRKPIEEMEKSSSREIKFFPIYFNKQLFKIPRNEIACNISCVSVVVAVLSLFLYTVFRRISFCVR